MSIYMKIEGITGDATDAGHAGWTAIDSFQFGVGRGVSTPVGDAARRETSKPSVSEITITKQMDGASIPLFTDALVENTGKKVNFDFVRSGSAGGLEIYAQYELTNALISGYSASSGGDRPSESLSLNFTKVMYTWKGGDATNKAGTPVTKTFDLAKATMA